MSQFHITHTVAASLVLLDEIAAHYEITPAEVTNYQVKAFNAIIGNYDDCDFALWSIAADYTAPSCRLFFRFPDASGNISQDFENIPDALNFVAAYYA